jgi:phosphatidylglycerol lysyltransferase
VTKADPRDWTIRAQPYLTRLIAIGTLGSGLVTLASVMRPDLPARHALLRDVFPLEFFHLSRLLTVLIGLALAVTSLNLARRKRGAFRLALFLSCVGVVGHLVQGHDWRAATSSAVLAGMLVVSRRAFTVRSGIYDLRSGATRLALIVAVGFGYGILGFWLLDRREFGIDFDFPHSVHQTLRFLLLLGDAHVVPRTHYARWFLDSLNLITAVGIAYLLFSFFRPVLYRYRTYPHERAIAARLTRMHGNSALDFFKYWPDKSFFFAPSQDAFLAYRVGGRHAIVLGDPVGPAEALEALVRAFAGYAHDNDWGIAFHQVPSDHLPLYHRLGFRRLKVGDDAIVELTAFNLEGRAIRDIRQAVHRVERSGITFHMQEPPLPDELLAELRHVSDEWLQIPGRRERGFTLGRFEDAYLRSSAVATAVDATGRVVAFMNQIPSFVPGEATVDLMRRRTESPHGVMDYLLVRLFAHLRERGFTRFNLGMAPMSGFGEHEDASPEERAVHLFFRRMTFLFSYTGLRAYKAKYASHWESRYLVYENVLQLPAVALAIGRVTELKDQHA